MGILLQIRESGCFPEIDLRGDGDLQNDGVIVDAPGATVVIGRFAVSNVRVPLIVKQVGKLLIREYMPYSFWGDSANFRCGNIHIDRFTPFDIQQRFAYDQYHQDVIFQAYAVTENGFSLDPEGSISNIHIAEIDVTTNLEQVNGIMLSERNRYDNFHLGYRRMRIGINAHYWLNANTLQDSVLGVGATEVFSLTGKYKPSVRIQNVKQSAWETKNVMLCGLPNLDKAVLPQAGVSVMGTPEPARQSPVQQAVMA